MVFKIVISRLAESEIEKTIEYYESRKKGLGKQFLEYFKGYLKILKTNPELFPIKKPPFYRELPLKKFPFVIIYEVFQDEVIVYSVFILQEIQQKSHNLTKLLLLLKLPLPFYFLFLQHLKQKNTNYEFI